MFLRGINHPNTNGVLRGDGYTDPEARSVGGTQDDEVGPHNHTLSTRAGAFCQASGNPNYASNIFTEPHNQGGIQAVELSQGKETRPNNVAVFYYVKIN
jgi:hypothetical protein